ncbi:hypothetical protein NW765_017613 [Fusarium oxysporum]|nr:hypothetical protein NW765_017613 [Fusarium oxysporum]KAJ4263733.1 hypothetical protein NW764_016029 [Fusarium oxysporum]
MRIKMQGFIIIDHVEDFPKARAELLQWAAQGKLKKTETIIPGGLRNAEQALIDLFNGLNKGKLLLEIKNPKESPASL